MTTNGRPVRLLRGYGWWIILVTLVLTFAAYGVSRLEPVDYRSTATAVVSPRLRASGTAVPANAATEREIARSGTVLGEVAKDLGISPGTLADGLDVDVVPDGGAAITVTYSNPVARVAQQRAQAVAAEYVGYRNSSINQYGIAASLVSPAGEAQGHRTPLWVTLPAGALAGLLIGLLTALWHARRRDRLRGRDHFERATGVPVLATIPRARRSRGPGAPLPVMLRSPDSVDAEAYRYLRARLDPRLERPATVLVAGGLDREGRSTTAANLAVALAQSGRRVVLVDTDVRRPALHLMFDLSRDRGLTNVLAGDYKLAETLAAGAIVNLRVLAVGADRDGASDLLAGGLAGLLHELKQQCDVVVLDSPALLDVADAIGLAAQSDQVLLVTDYRRTDRAGAVRVASELTQVAPGRVAAVLIGVPEREGGLVPRTLAGRAPAPAYTSGAAAEPVDRFAVLDGPGDFAAPAPPASAPQSPAPIAPAAPSAAPTSPAAPSSPAPAAPSSSAAPKPEPEPAAAAPAMAETKPKPARPITAKAAIPKPRVYASAAAKAEAEARVQAKVAAEAEAAQEASADK
ncbi:AAA family ATPase [Actinoplanes sp. URMC 104]|uniref:polysaccharide biosynthesis tyrosine autokinase n=1 Tax=Actinoplanes sp. URMC 104 TaxID=3423409 RepID=UPI003F1B7493